MTGARSGVELSGRLFHVLAGVDRSGRGYNPRPAQDRRKNRV